MVKPEVVEPVEAIIEVPAGRGRESRRLRPKAFNHLRLRTLSRAGKRRRPGRIVRRRARILRGNGVVGQLQGFFKVAAH